MPTTSTRTTPEPALDYSALTHELGAYLIVTEATQVEQAAEAGIGLVVGPSEIEDSTYQAALRASGIRVIDNAPKDMIYQATCPSGPASCREPDPQQLAELQQRLKAYVESVTAADTLAAYYILDDYRPALASVLPSAYQTIRQADPRRPIVCALAVSIVQANASDVNVDAAIADFKRALDNYSPQWCEAVMIYSYAPGGAAPIDPQGSWDWTMSKTLPKALSALRAKGWQPSRSPLIGVPQTFGYWPAVSPGGAAEPPQYQAAPTSSELTAQVVAFCRAGATAIVGYAWNDSAVGNVTELYNSVPLRLGLLAGAQQCHRSFWSSDG